MTRIRSLADCHACGTGAYFCQLKQIETREPCCSRCSHQHQEWRPAA